MRENHRYSLIAAAAAVLLSSGCGDMVRQGRSPSQLVIVSITTARGAGTVPTTFVNGPLLSDVPNVANSETVFDDFGQVTLRQILRDPGSTPGVVLTPTPNAPTDITVTEYEVRYRLANGRNTPGVDVPYPVHGALTLTLLGTLAGTATFELVRHVAKMEPPLVALALGDRVVTMIADVTFFGRDQAGNSVSATGSVQINFANFS